MARGQAWASIGVHTMTDSRREKWLRQAAARWAHLPEGEERTWRIQRTAAEIAAEAEQVAVALPQLDPAEAQMVLDEAVLDELHQWMPVQEATLHAVQPLIDEAVDRRFRQLELLAREQAAPVQVRAKLIERRLVRRLKGLRVEDWQILMKALGEVATLIAEEDDATTRALAEGAAVARITRSIR